MFCAMILSYVCANCNALLQSDANLIRTTINSHKVCLMMGFIFFVHCIRMHHFQIEFDSSVPEGAGWSVCQRDFPIKLTAGITRRNWTSC